jgi:uncharacterized protein (TIRG00374 family)
VLNKLLSPKVVIPTVIGLALIGALVGVSDAGKIAMIMQHLNPVAALGFVVLMMAYEAVRGVQWHVLLKGLGVRVPFSAQAFSFLLGEATKTAPIGNYFQNYLLSRVEGEDFGETSAATTLIVLTEVAWGLFAMVIVGIDAWGWLRPLILVGLSVFLVLASLVYRFEKNSAPPTWMTRHELTRTLLLELRRFRRGVAALIRPRPLATEAGLSAVYLLAAAGAMYLLALGLGVDQISYWQMLAIYMFGVTAGLILPLPVDLGVVELSGAGALVASGLNREVAISIVLLNRLLQVGTALVIAAVGMVFLRDELRQALHAGASPRPERADLSRTGPF